MCSGNPKINFDSALQRLDITRNSFRVASSLDDELGQSSAARPYVAITGSHLRRILEKDLKGDSSIEVSFSSSYRMALHKPGVDYHIYKVGADEFALGLHGASQGYEYDLGALQKK